MYEMRDKLSVHDPIRNTVPSQIPLRIDYPKQVITLPVLPLLSDRSATLCVGRQ